MRHNDDIGANYSYSYTTYSESHEFYQTPQQSTINPSGFTIPLAAFRHASCMQVVARHLVDREGLGFTAAAKILGRSPKSLWTSYHQAKPLPVIEESLAVPASIFYNKAPLEALVSYLKSLGWRNTEIAQALDLSPKTVWTAAKRAEVKR